MLTGIGIPLLIAAAILVVEREVLGAGLCVLAFIILIIVLAVLKVTPNVTENADAVLAAEEGAKARALRIQRLSSLKIKKGNSSLLAEKELEEVEMEERRSSMDKREDHQAIASLGLPRHQLDRYAANFNKVDLDGDGVISVLDLKKFLQNQGQSTNALELEKWIGEFDLDNDGEVSFEEFVTTMVKSQGIEKEDDKQVKVEVKQQAPPSSGGTQSQPLQGPPNDVQHKQKAEANDKEEKDKEQWMEERAELLREIHNLRLELKAAKEEIKENQKVIVQESRQIDFLAGRLSRQPAEIVELAAKVRGYEQILEAEEKSQQQSST